MTARKSARFSRREQVSRSAASTDQSAVEQPAGELEGRVGAQPVEIVVILVAQAAVKMRARRMSAMACVTRCGSRGSWIRSGQPVGQLQASLGPGQKHDAAIRSDASAIKRSCDLLARNGWNESGSNVSSVIVGVAPRDVVAGPES